MIVKYLLSLKADDKYKNLSGKTARELAVEVLKEMETSYNKKGEEAKKPGSVLVELKVENLSAAERLGLVDRLKVIIKILPEPPVVKIIPKVEPN